jgi:hypothetical protein
VRRIAGQFRSGQRRVAGRRVSGEPASGRTWLQEHRLAVIGTLITLTGVVVGVLSYLEGRRVADLAISSVAIGRAEEVPTTFQNAGEAPTEGQLHTDAIDLTVRNAGSVSGLVSEVRLHVEYAEALSGCWGAGGLFYSATYPIQMPPDRTTPYTLTEQIRFEVEGGRHDRFAVVLGPQGAMNEGAGPWLYVLRVDLVDEFGDTLSGGERIALMVPDMHEALMETAEGRTEWAAPCLVENLRTIEDAPLSETIVAPGVEQYRDALRKVAGSG